MLPHEREALAQQFHTAMLRGREDAKRFLGESRAVGDAKMVRKWGSRIRKLDALIAKCRD